MKTYYAIIALGDLFSVTGCLVPSLHPLYTDADLTFDPALIGQWAEKDSKLPLRDGTSETWTFTENTKSTESGEKKYTLVIADEDGKSHKFIVHLVKIKGLLFLDLFPDGEDLELNLFYRFHLLPVHTFMRVKQIEPTLQMAPLDYDWVDKFLRDHPDAIRHEDVDDGFIVFTAKPKELQAFLVKHEKPQDAFGEASHMIRKTEEQNREPNQ